MHHPIDDNDYPEINSEMVRRYLREGQRMQAIEMNRLIKKAILSLRRVSRWVRLGLGRTVSSASTAHDRRPKIHAAE